MENKEIKQETNKKKNNTLIFVVIFITIFFLVIISYRQAIKFDQALREFEAPRFEMPEIQAPTIPQFPTTPQGEFQMPNFNFPFIQNQENEEYYEFITPNETLKIKYSSNWIKKDENFLKILNQELELAGETSEIKILFIAQKFNLLEPLNHSILTIQKIYFEQELTIEEAINKIEKISKEMGTEIKIENLEIKDQKAQFSTTQRQDELIYFSKNKIFLIKNQVYLITFLTPKNYWLEFEDEAKEILDSVQLLTEKQ